MKSNNKKQSKMTKGPSKDGKKHLVISVLKSIVRMAGAVASMGILIKLPINEMDTIKAILVLALSIFVAEVLGIVEEVVDER